MRQRKTLPCDYSRVPTENATAKYQGIYQEKITKVESWETKLQVAKKILPHGSFNRLYILQLNPCYMYTWVRHKTTTRHLLSKHMQEAARSECLQSWLLVDGWWVRQLGRASWLGLDISRLVDSHGISVDLLQATSTMDNEKGQLWLDQPSHAQCTLEILYDSSQIEREADLHELAWRDPCLLP